MATIQDVAKEAGVSPSTVSRVINNSLVVSDSKRRRVLDAIEKLGYEIPTISKDSTGKLVLVVSDVPTNLFNDYLYRSIAARGYQMILFHYCEGANTERELYDFLQMMGPLQKIAGIVLVNFVRPIGEALKNCLNLYPTVRIGCRCPLARAVSLDINQFQAAYDATALLLGRGCRRIALYTPGQQNMMGIDRFFSREQLNGYRAALFDHGLAPEDVVTVETDFTAEGVCDTTLAMLTAGGTIPDAIMTPIDTMAIGCLRALRQRGIAVPEQVKLLALQDDWPSALATPPISTLVFPYERLAAEAARILFALIAGEPMESQIVTLPYEFALRESTGD